ncbi:RNA 2',3'-cyclic phosphodiesterase [Thermanaerosceptrum fracticalcis]|uniref:RNA 2',3'-cyclic phosphodiesterase n=1 Tax=Thermanaerosceptrum fracticalcis TaxID=1712410 RepID=A0A7G6E0T4_THEFR|nr:RNA 2',3'-cyclic phosphodiesterase [Thermanaerosceptrum fracticalcis]QNB45688.1 RNA 2',3'-cyclic phosphodiesterase [Thermanaerosceptrum fracticalcis]
MVQTIRAFWAFELPEPVVEAVTQLQTELARIFPHLRWVNSANLHLTLHFLGDIHPSLVEKMLREFTPILQKTPAPFMSLGKIGAFPRWSEPRVIWLSLTGNHTILRKIYGDTAAAIGKLGIPVDAARPYTPHITLARINTKLKPNFSGFATMKDHPLPNLPGFYLGKLTLYASKLTPAGPIYTPLHSYHLK